MKKLSLTQKNDNLNGPISSFNVIVSLMSRNRHGKDRLSLTLMDFQLCGAGDVRGAGGVGDPAGVLAAVLGRAGRQLEGEVVLLRHDLRNNFIFGRIGVRIQNKVGLFS